MVSRFFFNCSDDTIVEEVQVAYDVSKLAWLDQKRENSRRAKLYCESHAAKFGSGQQMKPCTCGIICSSCNCSCCANSTDALTFYKKEESDYNYEVEREKARVKTKSIGIAFVTFRTLSDAKKMLDDFKHSCRCFSGIVDNFITVNLNGQYFSNWCIGSPK